MTEKALTIKDLNCGNCPLPYCEGGQPHTRFKYCPIVDHYVLMWFDGGYIPYTQTAQDIMKTGCASHPLALQVLAEPVIRELERLYSESADTSYRDAIKLLKDVKK